MTSEVAGQAALALSGVHGGLAIDDAFGLAAGLRVSPQRLSWHGALLFALMASYFLFVCAKRK